MEVGDGHWSVYVTTKLPLNDWIYSFELQSTFIFSCLGAWPLLILSVMGWVSNYSIPLECQLPPEMCIKTIVFPSDERDNIRTFWIPWIRFSFPYRHSLTSLENLSTVLVAAGSAQNRTKLLFYFLEPDRWFSEDEYCVMWVETF